MNRINPNQNTEPMFSDELLEIMREARHTKLWRGTLDERKAKFQTLHANLCRWHLTGGDVQPWKLDLSRVTEPEAQHGNGGIDAHGNIVLVDKLSLVTLLYCFALKMNGIEPEANVGLDDEEAGLSLSEVLQRVRSARHASLTWAKALYRRIFRVSAANTTETADGRIVKSDPERN